MTAVLDEHIAVVGGGIGGLATACLLADHGATVTLFEQNNRVGGSANLIERDGFRFDTGPSWYLMPAVFERFFERMDRSPEQYYDRVQLDPHYRIHWKSNTGYRPDTAPDGVALDPDGDRIDVPPDPTEARSIFEAYEPGGAKALDEYLDTAEQSYEVAMEQFVYRDRTTFREYVDPQVALSTRGLPFFGTMQDHAKEHFDHPKLQQLVQYTLVFLGGAPHNTPALYNLMSHVDFNLGVWYPKGGMYSVVEALKTVGEELGVEYQTNCPVTGINPRGDNPVVRTPDRSQTVDRVVCNANPAHVERELLPSGLGRGDDYWDDRTYAPSAFMLFLGVEGELPSLEHHTLVLPADWDRHFETIFDDPQWPDDPSYYLCVPSKTDDSVAPDGHHAVVVLVPIAPGLADSTERREQFREQIVSALAEHADADLRNRIVVEEQFCVSDYERTLNAPQGTALGMAHTLFQTGPLRPGRRGPGNNLYYVGGYSTPGIGVPMCLISAEHTADTIVDDATSSDGPLSKLPGFGD